MEESNAIKLSNIPWTSGGQRRMSTGLLKIYSSWNNMRTIFTTSLHDIMYKILQLNMKKTCFNKFCGQYKGNWFSTCHIGIGCNPQILKLEFKYRLRNTKTQSCTIIPLFQSTPSAQLLQHPLLAGAEIPPRWQESHGISSLAGLHPRATLSRGQIP